MIELIENGQRRTIEELLIPRKERTSTYSRTFDIPPEAYGVILRCRVYSGDGNIRMLTRIGGLVGFQTEVHDIDENTNKPAEIAMFVSPEAMYLKEYSYDSGASSARLIEFKMCPIRIWSHLSVTMDVNGEIDAEVSAYWLR